MFRLFNRKKQPVVGQNDQWTIATSEEDGVPVLTRFRNSVPDGVVVGRYPQLVNLYWRYEAGREQAMPGAEDYERMFVLESHLEKIEGSNVGFMMLSVTGNCRKEWILYVRSDDVFLAALNAQLKGEVRFPIEVESAADAEWRNYFHLLSRIRET